MHQNKNIIANYLLILVLLFLGNSCRKDHDFMGEIICTIAAQNESLDTKNLNNPIPTGGQIAIINPAKEQVVYILTTDFYAAVHPQIDYDARYLLFAGKLNKDDVWQIWEMKFSDLSYRKITNGQSNAIHPAYLPDGKIVFCQIVENDSLKAYSILQSINPDGTGLERISFHPNIDLNPMIFKDGRVLFNTTQIFPEKSGAKLIAMRPDGTKAELFYEENNTYSYRDYSEDDKGKVHLVTTDSSHSGQLISLRFNNPYSTKNEQKSEQGDFHSIFSLGQSKLLASYRNTENENYGIYIIDDIDQRYKVDKWFVHDKYHLLDAVKIIVRNIPKKLPGIVNPEINQSWLMCMDANLTEISERKSSGYQATMIKTIHGETREIELASDGSFYVELPPDMPFKIESYGNDNNQDTLTSSWIWLRPNERRSCIGCHENREMAPENRVPEAIKSQAKNLFGSANAPIKKD